MQTEKEALRSELVVVTERLARVTQEKEDAIQRGVIYLGWREQQKARAMKAENERDSAWVVLDWLAENYPQILELCPYKARR